MHAFLRCSRAIQSVLIPAVLLAVIGAAPALAARDRTPPTKPANLRVTAVTPHNVTLAWNPSADDSGILSYRLWASYGYTFTVDQTQTTFSLGAVPGTTYSFVVHAVDGSGNKSAASNTLSVSTPADITAPTPPVVVLAGVNPAEIALAWSASVDDGPFVLYRVYVNGSPAVDAGQSRTAVLHGLTPTTTYSITVKARDLHAQNVSAPSNVLTVTTAAFDVLDTEPPAPPGNLSGYDAGDGAREINLSWQESFDNQTSQASIDYEVYRNGVFDHIAGGNRTVLYAAGEGENTFTVVAVDDAGNRSPPASVTIASP
jgi:chitodextrinase